MALKYRYAKKEEIPAGQDAFYVERDGAFVLDAEGMVAKEKLDEFRNNNVNLTKQLTDLQKQFEGIDPAKAAEVREALRKIEEGELLKKGDVEGLVNGRVKSIVESKNATEAALAKVTEELAVVRINQAVITAATARGLRSSAIPDLAARARQTFKLVDGRPVAFAADGKTQIYGADGVSPLTLDEWTQRLAVDAPHLFENNAGGGAAGGGSGGAGGLNGGKNPFKKGPDWNITKQMELTRKDPKLAERLKAAA